MAEGRCIMLLAEYIARTSGIKYVDIAKSCGVHKTLIGRVIRGKERAYPKLQRGIAFALDWPIDRAAELFEEITDVKTKSGWLREEDELRGDA